jgi:hypothetical protein
MLLNYPDGCHGIVLVQAISLTHRDTKYSTRDLGIDTTLAISTKHDYRKDYGVQKINSLGVCFGVPLFVCCVTEDLMRLNSYEVKFVH